MELNCADISTIAVINSLKANTMFPSFIGFYPIEIDAPTSSEKEPEQPLLQSKVSRGDEEGYECISCKIFCPYAELNYPLEGIHNTFKCFTCRNRKRA